MSTGAGVLAVDGGALAAPLLATATAKALARGSKVETLALHDLALPVFAGTGPVPKTLARLQTAVANAAAIVIASPEMAGAVAPVVINALAWLDHAAAKKPALAGKAVALLASTPYGGVGMRTLTQLAAVLGGQGALVMPYPLAVAADQIDAKGIGDAALAGQVELLGERLFDVVARLAANGTKGPTNREIGP